MRLSAASCSCNGAWFSIGKGELHWRDPETGAFSVVAAEDPEIERDNRM